MKSTHSFYRKLFLLLLALESIAIVLIIGVSYTTGHPLPKETILLSAMLLALMLAISFVFLRKASAPLNTLTRGARQIIKEESGPYIDENKMPTEFFTIAKALNKAMDQLQLNEQLQQSNQNLKIETQQLENQLQQSQKMETIGTLAGGIAHDFNNILASITGYAQLAIEDAATESEQEENLNYLLTAAHRAADLANQILAFTRHTDTEKKPIQAYRILEESLKLLRATLPSTIRVQSKIHSESTVMAAPTQIQQVVVNICSNAAHAMQESSGILSIKLTDINLDATNVETSRMGKVGPYIKLSISDTGHGIPPEIIERIFDPYFTTKKAGEGTGIGLSVVQGIVRSHGGFVTVESPPGKGSTFNVHLPVINHENIPHFISPTKVIGGDEHILFVDDEEYIIHMANQTLERLGYSVTTCTNGLEAFALFKKTPEQFDLIITDFTMPNLTGDQLAKKIIDIRPGIPIIMCTGYSHKINAKNAAKAGIRSILHKPLAKHVLAGTIRYVLEAEQPVPATVH